MTYSVMLVSDISQQNESIIHIYLLFQILSYVSHHRVLSRVPCVTEQGLVQLLSHARLLAAPWTAAHQVSLSFTISWSLLKLMSIESVMPSTHFVLCRPLLLPSIFPGIRVFSNELALIFYLKGFPFNLNMDANTLRK